jgi:carotenoid 1,2-hydratase
VFSPWYAWSARERPENHVALNVALYGGGADRWCMTERGRDALRRDRSSLAIGPSSVAWDLDALTIRFDEWTAPVPPWPTIPKPMRGVVRVRPTGLNAETFRLDAAGRHLWTPIAPRARVEVETDEPGVRWSGTGYLDCNAGSEPLEDAFSDWNWSRAHLGRDTAIAYDLRRRHGTGLGLALRFAPDGRVEPVEPPSPGRLPPTVWRVGRTARVEAARLERTWEDTPFYARSTVRGRLLGEDAVAVHESLSLDRLCAPWVRTLLPFRMPRALR